MENDNNSCLNNSSEDTRQLIALDWKNGVTYIGKVDSLGKKSSLELICCRFNVRRLYDYVVISTSDITSSSQIFSYEDRARDLYKSYKKSKECAISLEGTLHLL